MFQNNQVYIYKIAIRLDGKLAWQNYDTTTAEDIKDYQMAFDNYNILINSLIIVIFILYTGLLG